jgi:hypothetical protein
MPYKWRQGQRDSQVGHVVLLKDKTAAGNTYKLARVVEVFRDERDERDGKVRKLSVAYKNINKNVFRTSTRPIHKIVLVPAEDANLPPLPANINPPPDQTRLTGFASPIWSSRGPVGHRHGFAGPCWT